MGSNETLRKIGKYFLLDMIAQGGMAEIYRARMASKDSGDRLIAIKKIISTFSQNPEFTSMFKSEIKMTSALSHPNIVQVYDYGEESGNLFIAMEFVDGKNLHRFLSRFNEKKSYFPIELCMYVIEQAARGMAYAHSYKDKFTGKPLNIVHRDISPQNILISYDGGVKIIDFGIAKAVTNVEATRAGVIKGKPSYLSPEQIAGEVLDGRSDIFALGVVLWELLSGKKLFASDNDFGVLKLIESCNTHVKPPSTVNPKVPKELDSIVLRCLQKDRDQRYLNAEELQRALHKFLYIYSPEFNPADLGYFAREMFKNEIVEDRKQLLSLNDKAETLLAHGLADVPLPNKNQGDLPSDTSNTIQLTKPTATVIPQTLPDKKLNNVKPELTFDLDSKEKSSITIEFSNNASKRLERNKSGKGEFAATGNTNRTNIGKLEKNIPSSQSSSVFQFVALIGIVGAALGYYYFSGSTHPFKQVSDKGSASIVFSGAPKAATVMVDGKVVGQSLPVELEGLEEGVPHQIKVFSNGFGTFEKEITLGSSESKKIEVNLVRLDGSKPIDSIAQKTESTATVSLIFEVSPPGLGTQIKVNGSLIDFSGVTQAKAGSTVEVAIEREGFRTYRSSFVVEEAKLDEKGEFHQKVQLNPARFGYVSIKTTPSSDAIVSIDGVEEKWQLPISRKRVPVGDYKIKLQNSVLGMEKEISIQVDEDRFTNIEERLSIKNEDQPSRLPGSN